MVFSEILCESPDQLRCRPSNLVCLLAVTAMSPRLDLQTTRATNAFRLGVRVFPDGLI